MGKEKTSKNRKYIYWFWMFSLFPIFAVIILITSVRYFSELPDTLALQNPQTNLASEVYSSDLKVIGKYYAENRTNVKFREISPNVINALIATEDARFFGHSGVDVRALGRAVFGVLIGRKAAGGGSTLTQQLAKMLFPRERLSKPELVIRKMKEWIIAVKLEREYTKQEIMALYLNKFDFINSAVGIKSAAQIYFDSSPDSLKIEQAAMLVGMAKNPSLYNPNRFIDRSKGRRNTVLNQMYKYDYITEEQCDSLKALPLTLSFRRENHNDGLAPYFREYLRDVFLKNWCDENRKPDGTKYNIYRDGLKIYTTIDSRMQGYAEEAVTEHLSSLQQDFIKECAQKRNAPFAWNVTKEEIKGIMTQGMKRSERYRILKKAGTPIEKIKLAFDKPIPMAIFTWKGEKDTILSPMDSIRYYKGILQTGFMSIEPQTGYIKAWVGGINHKFFKYDHVQIGHTRQVGSTFKPFIYALAIQEGYSPCYRLPNVQTCIDMPEGQPVWCPKNSDDKLDGKMLTLQQALANSVNFISAYLIKQYGAESVVKMARKMGIVSPIDAVPSICLGTPEISVFEMVGANATFANKGTWIQPNFVTRIEDKNGKVIATFSPLTEEVLNEEKAYVMLQLMKGVVSARGGTGRRVQFRYKLYNEIAGKTGTTQNNSDGWFMGITPELVSGCWTGAEDRAVHFDKTSLGQGANMALPIWGKYMQKVYADKTINLSKEDFEKPEKPMEIELDCGGYAIEPEADTGGSDGADPDGFNN